MEPFDFRINWRLMFIAVAVALLATVALASGADAHGCKYKPEKCSPKPPVVVPTATPSEPTPTVPTDDEDEDLDACFYHPTNPCQPTVVAPELDINPDGETDREVGGIGDAPPSGESPYEAFILTPARDSNGEVQLLPGVDIEHIGPPNTGSGGHWVRNLRDTTTIDSGLCYLWRNPYNGVLYLTCERKGWGK